MKKFYPKITCSLLTLILLAVPNVNAQDDGDYSSNETGLWQGSVEFGVRKTTGNTNISSFNGKLNLVQNLTYWRNTYIFQSNYATANDSTTAEQYRGSIQSDYKFTNNEFLFVKGEAEKDRFSGYRYKSSVSTGYGNRLWQGADGSYFEASAGIGYQREQLIQPQANSSDFDNGLTTNFSAKLEKYVSDTTTFKQNLSTQIDMEYGSNEIESVTSLQTDIISDIAMKMSYRVTYDSQVPVDKAHTNTETSITFLYSF